MQAAGIARAGMRLGAGVFHAELLEPRDPRHDLDPADLDRWDFAGLGGLVGGIATSPIIAPASGTLNANSPRGRIAFLDSCVLGIAGLSDKSMVPTSLPVAFPVEECRGTTIATCLCVPDCPCLS